MECFQTAFHLGHHQKRSRKVNHTLQFLNPTVSHYAPQKWWKADGTWREPGQREETWGDTAQVFRRVGGEVKTVNSTEASAYVECARNHRLCALAPGKESRWK